MYLLCFNVNLYLCSFQLSLDQTQKNNCKTNINRKILAVGTLNNKVRSVQSKQYENKNSLRKKFKRFHDATEMVLKSGITVKPANE